MTDEERNRLNNEIDFLKSQLIDQDKRLILVEERSNSIQIRIRELSSDIRQFNLDLKDITNTLKDDTKAIKDALSAHIKEESRTYMAVMAGVITMLISGAGIFASTVLHFILEKFFQ